MPHTSAESREAMIPPIPVNPETAWCFWPGPEGRPNGLEYIPGDGFHGRMAERQMADRARDHTYN